MHSAEEDVFAPVGQAVKNRWAWLAINLCTAFVASRVIGVFEHTISQLVALATLMPIVAAVESSFTVKSIAQEIVLICKYCEKEFDHHAIINNQ